MSRLFIFLTSLIFGLLILWPPAPAQAAIPLRLTEQIVTDHKIAGDNLTIEYNLPATLANQASGTYFIILYTGPSFFDTQLSSLTVPQWLRVNTKYLEPGKKSVTVNLPNFSSPHIYSIETWQDPRTDQLFDANSLRGTLPVSRYRDFLHLMNAFFQAVIQFRSYFYLLAMMITGIMFMMAAGDPEKLKKAKNNFVWVIIAIVVFTLAFMALDILHDFLQDLLNQEFVIPTK